MSAEADFYRRQYQGGIATPGAPGASGADALQPGQRYSLVAEKLPITAKAGDTLVELGCGSGQTLKFLSQIHPFGRVVGVDIAVLEPTSLDGIEFRSANLNDEWPFASQSIDHLVAMMLIEHLFDPFHSFSEIRRTLTPKGMAYVNLPLVTSIRNRLRLLFGYLPVTSVGYERWFDDRNWDGNHLHYFSVDSIRRLAAACGLRVVDMRGVGRMHRLKSKLPSIFAAELTFSLARADGA
ncbi:MAG: methyltransferase domain-containing protein [Telluria sp.]|nr:methyltransferase domain-containing protein [Telluria sp.]